VFYKPSEAIVYSRLCHSLHLNLHAFSSSWGDEFVDFGRESARVLLSHTHAKFGNKAFISGFRDFASAGGGKLDLRLSFKSHKLERRAEMRLKIRTWRIPGQERNMSSLRSTKTLPDHILPILRHQRQSSSSPPTNFPFLVPDVVPPPPTQEEMSPAGKIFRLTWPTNPRNILIVKKRRDSKVTEAAITFAKYRALLFLPLIQIHT